MNIISRCSEGASTHYHRIAIGARLVCAQPTSQPLHLCRTGLQSAPGFSTHVCTSPFHSSASAVPLALRSGKLMLLKGTAVSKPPPLAPLKQREYPTVLHYELLARSLERRHPNVEDCISKAEFVSAMRKMANVPAGFEKATTELFQSKLSDRKKLSLRDVLVLLRYSSSKIRIKPPSSSAVAQALHKSSSNRVSLIDRYNESYSSLQRPQTHSSSSLYFSPSGTQSLPKLTSAQSLPKLTSAQQGVAYARNNVPLPRPFTPVNSLSPSSNIRPLPSPLAPLSIPPHVAAAMQKLDALLIRGSQQKMESASVGKVDGGYLLTPDERQQIVAAAGNELAAKVSAGHLLSPKEQQQLAMSLGNELAAKVGAGHVLETDELKQLKGSEAGGL